MFVAFLAALVGSVGVSVVAVGILVAGQVGQGSDVQQVVNDLQAVVTTPGMFIALGLASQLMLGLAALVPARLSPEPTGVRLGWVRPDLRAWGYVVFALSSLLPLAIGVFMATQLARVLPPDPSVRLMYEKMTPAMAVPFVLFIALGPGFMEELLFRGYMQRRLLRRWSPAVAITVVSLLFAVMHVTPHGILVALPIGFWFGVIAWRTGSIWPTIACHAFVNGGWNLWNLGGKFGGLPPASHPAVAATGAGIGVVCFIASLRLLARQGSEAVPAATQAHAAFPPALT